MTTSRKTKINRITIGGVLTTVERGFDRRTRFTDQKVSNRWIAAATEADMQVSISEGTVTFSREIEADYLEARLDRLAELFARISEDV
jgi:hypothetical protein